MELALSLCLDEEVEAHAGTERNLPPRSRGLVVLGTDQGMAGQFNEHLVEAVAEWRDAAAGEPRIWAVGERVLARLENVGVPVERAMAAPQSVEAISGLVSELLPDLETAYLETDLARIDILHQASASGSGYKTHRTPLLPLDHAWREAVREVAWPTRRLPELIAGDEGSLESLVSEFLFVTLYRALAESAAAENGARLAAMQRAERNIEERQRELTLDYNRHRQATIDEELFDLVAGYRSQSGKRA